MHPIISILTILGLNPMHKGFMCIAKLLHYLLSNPAKLCGHMKTELYPLIEEEFGLSYENAKRAIKFAIISANFNNDPALRKMFFPDVHADFPPTISEFLYRTLGILRAELSQYSEEHRQAVLKTLKPVPYYGLPLIEKGEVRVAYNFLEEGFSNDGIVLTENTENENLYATKIES